MKKTISLNNAHRYLCCHKPAWLKYLGALLLCFITLAALTLPANIDNAKAQEEAKAADYSVTANVASPVSAAKSKVDINTLETLADPVNHPVLVTVTLRDANNQLIEKRKVDITSSRGVVDVIEAVDKVARFQAQAADSEEMRKGTTDSSGQASFRITSFVPGKADLKVIADNVVNLKNFEVQFLPLPFPAYFSLSLDVPFSSRDIALYEPATSNDKLSPLQEKARGNYNPGANVKLPLWALVLIILVVVVCPVLLFTNFITLRHIRRMEIAQSNAMVSQLKGLKKQ